MAEWLGSPWFGRFIRDGLIVTRGQDPNDAGNAAWGDNTHAVCPYCKDAGGQHMKDWQKEQRKFVGYSRFVVQGGDWGSFVAQAMATSTLRPLPDSISTSSRSSPPAPSRCSSTPS